jgi:hypothetical protein
MNNSALLRFEPSSGLGTPSCWFLTRPVTLRPLPAQLDRVVTQLEGPAPQLDGVVTQLEAPKMELGG